MTTNNLKKCSMRKFNKVYLKENSDLCVFEGSELDIYHNFLENSTFFLEQRDKVKKTLSKSAENETNKDNNKEATEENYDFMVCPFNFNTLHIYSYEKQYMSQENLLSIKNLPMALFFNTDIHGRNCFDILSETHELNIFTSFLNYILKNSSMKDLENLQDGHCFDSKFFKKLIGLFQDDSKLVNQFLDFVFSQPIDFPENLSYRSLKKPIIINMNESSLNRESLEKQLEQNKNLLVEDDEEAMKEIVLAKCLYCPSFLDYEDPFTNQFFKAIS